MDVGLEVRRCVERKRAEDGAHEPEPGCVLHPPERRDAGFVE